MGVWTVIWAVIIIFSLTSFTYLSIKILYKGLGELKFMLSTVESEDDDEIKE